jgi:hypothetical protein
MKTFVKVSAVVLLCFTKALAQDGGTQAPSYDLPKIEDLVKIPPSPEAQAFVKYGNTSVSMYTGSPDISIPIATLKGRDITIPISLTYDASGVKVDQISTWVGIGWNLAAGGAITRQANGNPDDYLGGSYTTHYSITNGDFQFVTNFGFREGQTYPPGDIMRYYNFMTQNLGGKYDTQPDVYSFHVNGLSGTIYIDYDLGIGYCMEHPELKVYPEITPTGSGGVIKLITGWHLVDQMGTTYYFRKAERTDVSDMNAQETGRSYYSSWFVTQIVTANNRDIVDFNYTTPALWSQPQLAGRSNIYTDLPPDSFGGLDQLTVPPLPVYQIYQSDLASIAINGRVMAQFTAGPDERLDLKGKYPLSTIATMAEDGTSLKTFVLHQSYFNNGNSADEKDYRLKLDAVEVRGNVQASVGVAPPQWYKFSYFGTSLPNRGGFGDYWGYNNGNVTTGVYAFPYNYDYDKDNGMIQGADRRPDFNSAKIGSLYKITYPTGGWSTFNYIGHQSSETTYTYHDIFQFTSGLTGGIDDTDPFGYRTCNDGRYGVSPKGGNAGFTITEEGMYNVTFVSTGSFHATWDFQFASIYKSIDKGAPDTYFYQNFCDLLNGGGGLRSWYGSYTNYQETFQLYLTPGKYAMLFLNSNPLVTIGIEVKKDIYINSTNVGGLRVYKTTDKKEDGSIAQMKYYYYDDLTQVPTGTLLNENFFTQNASSGLLQQKLQFEEYNTSHTLNLTSNNTLYAQCEVVDVVRLNRYSTNQMKADHLITYGTVTEVQYDSTKSAINGFTVYDFINKNDNYSVAYNKATVLNGRLSQKSIYDSNYNLLNLEANYYSENTLPGTEKAGFLFRSFESVSKDIALVNQGVAGSPEYYVLSDMSCSFGPHDGGPMTANPTHCTGINYLIANQINCIYGPTSIQNKYVVSLAQRWPRLDVTRQVAYSGVDSLVTVVHNYYDNTQHYQLTRRATTDSKGITTIDKIYYPSELSSTTLTAMVAQNQIAVPVQYERYTNGLVKNNVIVNNGTLLEKKYTDYASWSIGGNTLLLPQTVQFATFSNPLEVRMRYVAFDNVGNPTVVSKENDIKMSYLWNSFQTLPTAQILNSGGATCYYNDFENGNSATGDAKSGVKSLITTTGFTQSLGAVVNGSYLLSYSQKVSGAWTYQSQPVTVSTSTYTVNIPGSVQIDELRFQPVGSQMTTYTYQSGVGETSVTDSNFLTTHFEYDNFGRLLTVRDNNYKILKNYAYHYKNSNGNQ